MHRNVLPFKEGYWLWYEKDWKKMQFMTLITSLESQDEWNLNIDLSKGLA